MPKSRGFLGEYSGDPNDYVWADAEGNPLELSDMDANHRRNVLGYLWKHIEAFRFKIELAEIRLSSAFMPNIDTVAFDMVNQCLEEQWDMTNEEFYNALPIVCALRDTLKGEDNRVDFWDMDTKVTIRGKRKTSWG